MVFVKLSSSRKAIEAYINAGMVLTILKRKRLRRKRSLRINIIAAGRRLRNINRGNRKKMDRFSLVV